MSTERLHFLPASFRHSLATSSWLPRNSNQMLSFKLRNTSRSLRPARHSKMSPCNLRIPRPEWICGRPNDSWTRAIASRASARALSCNATSRSRNWDVRTNCFFKIFDGGIFDSDTFAAFLRPFRACIQSASGTLHVLFPQSVFLPQVFVVDRHPVPRRFGTHFDWVKCDDGRAGNDSHVLAFDRCGEPLAQVLLRIGDCQRLHMAHLRSPNGLVNNSFPSVP